MRAARFADSSVLEKDPGPFITVQGRLHHPNSVPYGVSAHSDYFSVQPQRRNCLVCSSAHPIRCSDCLTCVRILGQEGHRLMLSSPRLWCQLARSCFILADLIPILRCSGNTRKSHRERRCRSGFGVSKAHFSCDCS